MRRRREPVLGQIAQRTPPKLKDQGRKVGMPHQKTKMMLKLKRTGLTDPLSHPQMKRRETPKKIQKKKWPSCFGRSLRAVLRRTASRQTTVQRLNVVLLERGKDDGGETTHLQEI